MLRTTGLLILAGFAAACGDASGVSDSGSLTIIVTTVGAPHPDAYTLQVGTLAARTVATTDSAVVPGLVPGSTTVALSGLAANCTVAGGASRSVAVTAGDTLRVAFDVSCQATTGNLQVFVTTTGLDLDADGYDLTLDDVPAGHAHIQDTLDLPLSPGVHTLTVSGRSANCHIEEGDRRTLTAEAGSTTSVSLTARCGYVLVASSALSITSLDGAHTIQLASNLGAVAYQPAWSRDGQRIAFASLPESSYGIRVVNADGSGLARLTTDADWTPAWSPDGTRIAFSRNGAIWMMNADGSDQHQLPDATGNDESPSWSPDGQFIAHSCIVASRRAICVMRPDGSDRRTVYATDSTDEQYPAWSPDGSRIAFSQTDGLALPARLSVVNADGTGFRQLTSGPGEFNDLKPTWSLGGETIVFQRYDYGTGFITLHTLQVADPAVVSPTGVTGLDFGGVQPR